MGVRLRERRRYASDPCREHHRPCDVPSAAENDVRLPTPEDAEACKRRVHGLYECTDEPDPEPAREPRDREGVELEAGLRNQPRLDAVGRPGEGHRYPAVAQRFRDGERRPNVPCGSAGCDQTHELRRLVHSRRC